MGNPVNMNRFVSIYTEQTTSPENLKFVANMMLYSGRNVEYLNAESVKETSPLADELFKLPYVRSVSIADNYVTVGKNPEIDWYEVMAEIKEIVKGFLVENKTIVDVDLLNKLQIDNIRVEQTPNPENVKFVTGVALYEGKNVDYPNAESVNGTSPLAEALFNLPFVKNVFIANNFATVGKTAEADWYEIMPQIKEVIRGFLVEEKTIVNEEALFKAKVEQLGVEASGEDAEMIERIKAMLEKYVQPAVEMDGGSIVFKDYNEGIVTLGMQGACAGCPSSTITLKAGIEGMMKRMIPEVKEVVAEVL